MGFHTSNTSARYILLSRLGLGINFIQWIPLRSYNDKICCSRTIVNQNVSDYNQFKSLIKQRMLDQHLQTWKSKVDTSSKCTF